ncbi:MAG: DsbA family protein [Gammaproteobacteria bacterium]|nr:DsbA family protein [Gammaproteobacteria bacterium]
MNSADPIRISYFSDVLCVWAYAAQIRLDELKKEFGDKVELHYHFIPVFGSAEHKLEQLWEKKGGMVAFNTHVRSVCESFPHLEINPEVWLSHMPKTSATSHLFLKAVQLLEKQGEISSQSQDAFDGRSLFEETMWQTRLAFFRDNRQIDEREVLMDIAESLGLQLDNIQALMDNGAAMAEMCLDAERCKQHAVEGSPFYILNEGRQKLYGNVGYKIIAANVQEILSRPEDQASWC